MLEVCRQFREAGKKTHPLLFAASESGNTSPARVRFNVEADILVMPACYLQLPISIRFQDFDKLLDLVIEWDISRYHTYAIARRLVDHEILVKHLYITRTTKAPLGAPWARYLSFTTRQTRQQQQQLIDALTFAIHWIAPNRIHAKLPLIHAVIDV